MWRTLPEPSSLPPPNKASLSIPSAGDVLREVDRARTAESKVRVNSGRLDPIDSIGQLLSITVGRNTPAKGIFLVQLIDDKSTFV
jgi:hypothetical protein